VIKLKQELFRRIKELIGSDRGETLVESIVSVFIMGILFTTIAMMIVTSFRMTNTSVERAEENQEEFVNPLVLTEFAGDIIDITFMIGGIDGIIATHQVVFSAENGILAFSPDLEEDEP